MRALLLLSTLAWPALVRAQDTLPRVEAGVRVGITYTPGSRPGLAVTGGRGAMLDSIRAILERDLDYSDRFEMVAAPRRGSDTGAAESGAADYAALAALGADYVVAVVPAGGGGGGGGGGAEVLMHDVRAGVARFRRSVAGRGGPEIRGAVHRAADEMVRVAAGTPGIAATAILFVAGGRLVRVDADGEGVTEVRAAGRPPLSPAWSPGGRWIAYTAFVRSGQPIVLHDLVTGRREVVPTTEYGLNITPEFAPDGRKLAFAHGTDAGTDIYVYDLGRRCCVERLTAGRFSDNLSPTWSPDGSRIAFISTRAGTPQLYVMASDGTGPEILARFDFGATGATNGPAWSPDGQAVAFHRDVDGTPQVFVLDLGSRALRQITGSGRNEDPTWAPDGRHLAFVSTRGGPRQVWIVDLETGRLRELTSTAGARLPAWSPRLSP